VVSGAGDVGEACEVGDGEVAAEAGDASFEPLGRARSTSPLKPVDDETAP
jgi:hypothetical protein